ncbi:MAG: hypothetical protein U0V74_08840 [Chitinophagales bacterium]
MKKLLCAVAVVLTIASCSKKYPIDPLPDDSTPPALTNLPASFAAVDSFVPFGGTLSSGQLSKGYTFHFTNSNQNIAAVCKGIITAVDDNGDGSVAITARYKANSIYYLYYSGIENTTVQVNDSIVGGSNLGKLRASGAFYLAVIKSNTEMRCPNTYASSGFMMGIDQAIAKHNQFNPSDSVYSACLIDSLPK